MRIALDTNRYADLARGDSATQEICERAEEIHLTIITLGELRAGFLGGNRSSSNERNLIRFLNESSVHVLAPDDATRRCYAEIFVQLRGNGTPIPTNDIWLAALCVQHDLILASRDAHFENIPQLPRV